MQTRLEVQGKDVVVLGLGRSGMAAASLLCRAGARVVVRDEADGQALAERADQLRQLGVRVELGGRFEAAERFDLAVLSPGISLNRPIVRELMTHAIPLLSELELAYRFCECPTVAVTGTNGKTTTTELINSMFGCCGKRSAAAGNNGCAFSGMVENAAVLDVLVLEVSSFQLEKIEQFRPHVAVMLSISPDHLDRHTTMASYAAAKGRVFMNQGADDWAVISTEALQWMRRVRLSIRSRLITFCAYGRPADLWLDPSDGQTIWARLPECQGVILRLDETHLCGRHNAENILATLATGFAMGLSVAQMREGICSYCPQPHRCEFVTRINGVNYVNDSKATNVDAVEKALSSLRDPVVLIAGGRDKGLDFSIIKEAVVRKVRLAVVIGEAQDKLCAAWQDAVPCVRAASMAEAVRVAASHARSGETVLLSPACASFDMFENYEHRGEEFKRWVLQLR